MSDTATPAPAAKLAKKTSYIVLRLATPAPDDSNHGMTLHVHSHTLASSAHEAIRTAVDGSAGTYVAVPARSWKPVTVKIEQTTRVKLEDA